MSLRVKGTKYQTKQSAMAVYRLHLTNFVKLNPRKLGTFFLYVTPDTAQFFMRNFGGIVKHHSGKALHVLFKALPLSSYGLTYPQGYFCQADSAAVLDDMLQCMITRNLLPSEALPSCLIGGSFINLWPKAILEGTSSTQEQRTVEGLRALQDVLRVHSGKQGLFLIYKLLSKILHFYSAYFAYTSLWSSMLTGQLSQSILQHYKTNGKKLR